MYCCFTGHRPQHLPWGVREDDKRCILLKKLLYNIIEDSVSEGYTDFYNGMAIGTDMYAAEAVLKLSEKYDAVKLHAAIPCPDQSKGWNEAQCLQYEKLLSFCATKTLISPFYTKSCMLTRNRFMVDSSDLIIAVWNGNFRSGTGYTIKYAKSLGKPFFIINPYDLSVKSF